MGGTPWFSIICILRASVFKKKKKTYETYPKKKKKKVLVYFRNFYIQVNKQGGLFY
jgi:hypothetical protein